MYWPPQVPGVDLVNNSDSLTENLVAEGSFNDGGFVASERLTRDYGIWTPYHDDVYTIDGGVTYRHTTGLRVIGYAPRQFGQTAVELESSSGYVPPPNSPYWETTGFIFSRPYDDSGNRKPINILGWNLMRFFFGAKNKVAGKNNLVYANNNGRVNIFCANGAVVAHDFTYTPRAYDDPGGFELVSLQLSSFVQVGGVYPFDWTNVVGFDIEFKVTGTGYYWLWGGYKAWLDGGPFFYKNPVQYDLVVKTFEDSGKELNLIVTVTNPYGQPETRQTPCTFALLRDNGGLFHIEAPSTRFLHWTTPGGQIQTPEFDYQPSTNATITAMYSTLVMTTTKLSARRENGSALSKRLKYGTQSPQLTPFEWRATPGSTITITVIDVSGFVKWEDGSTELIRTINIGYTTIDLVAIYTNDTQDDLAPQPTTYIWVLGGIGAVAVMGVGGLLLKRKRKSKLGPKSQKQELKL